jgi:hypothetical protein
MADPDDEVERLVAQVQAREDGDSETPPAPVRRVRKTTGGRKTSRSKNETAAPADATETTAAADEPASGRSIEEMDIDDLMPKGLPAPDGTLKSLGDLYAKFGIGRHPDMRVYIYRSYPKIGPRGVKVDGFLDEYDTPLTEQQIQADYGGGQYRVVVVGPHPTDPRLPKHYGSIAVTLAGEPNWERKPRATRSHEDYQARGAANPPPLPIPAQENTKITEVALKMFQTSASEEREERRRMERKMEEERNSTRALAEPIAEAERRRADDLIQAERERGLTTQRFLEKQLEEQRIALLETKRQMEAMSNSRPSIGAELRELAEAGLFSNREGDAARAMFNTVLEKHRDEVAGLNTAHSDFIKQLRQSHANEIEALRAASARELVAEREASRSREERIEERLKTERDERRRDQERHRQDLEQRDVHWKDRMEQALATQQSSWEARHQSLVSTYENRTIWLQAEVDRYKQEAYDLRMKQDEKGDIGTQLLKMKELSTLVKEIGGGDAVAPASAGGAGGLGISGGDDWKAAFAGEAMERLPMIVDRLFGGGGLGGGAPEAPPQQQYYEGQVVGTPQGPMEVVRDPSSGQLALAPKEALDRYRAQQGQQPSARAALPPANAPRASRAPARRRPPSVSATPNLAEGLPRRRPPWEGGGDDARAASPPPPAPPPPAPRMTTRSEVTPPAEPMELNNLERQALRVIAKEVHESVSGGEDPEEFVAKMMEKYPPDLLRKIVGEYNDRQIVQGLLQLEPRSAGATPAGQGFMLTSFQMMRQALG